MAYFRLKRQAVGEAYERFLRERLAPGGTIWLVDCGLDWGVSRAGDRHFFQHGALGGPTEEEYRDGGPRRLARPAHLFRATRGHVRTRGDLFGWWNQRRGIETRRLLVSSFILLDPTLTLHTGAIPFWIVFNTECSADALGHYLAARPRFDAIDMTLFSHGVDSIGLVPLSRWAQLRKCPTKGGALFGVDPRTFPKDFGNFMRYHRDLVTHLPPARPLPSSLALGDFDAFLAAHEGRYAVRVSSVDGPLRSGATAPSGRASA
jgi:hypothetical protein